MYCLVKGHYGFGKGSLAFVKGPGSRVRVTMALVKGHYGFGKGSLALIGPYCHRAYGETSMQHSLTSARLSSQYM
jgi:hypothetical protein